MLFVPGEEAKYSPARNLPKAVGDGVVDGNGEQAWAAAWFFRDAANAAGEEGRRQRADVGELAAAPKEIDRFDADGRSTSEIPAKKATPCTSSSR